MAKDIKLYDVEYYHCPICGRKDILYRRREKTYWCRICGQEFRLRKVKKKKGQQQVDFKELFIGFIGGCLLGVVCLYLYFRLFN